MNHILDIMERDAYNGEIKITIYVFVGNKNML